MKNQFKKPEKSKKLSLKKFEIYKFQKLNNIKGGNSTSDYTMRTISK